jgi:hypothetical protein
LTITPVTDLPTGTFIPLTFTVEYIAGLTLDDIPLPKNYTWESPFKPVKPEAGTQIYTGRYTYPSMDTLPVTGEITLIVWINSRLKALDADGDLSPVFSPSAMQYELLIPCSGVLALKAKPSSGGTVTYRLNGDEVALPITLDEPGTVSLVLHSVGADGMTATDYDITILVRYPSYILRQYWNDVLAVNLNPKTNGGFQFIGYEWTRDDRVLFGEAGPYLYFNGNPIAGTYTVNLTRDDGVTIPSCPFYYDGQLQENVLKVYPNPASISATVVNPEWETVKTMELYNSVGLLVCQYPCGALKTEIDVMGLRTGWYVLRVGKQSINLVIDRK